MSFDGLQKGFRVGDISWGDVHRSVSSILALGLKLGVFCVDVLQIRHAPEIALTVFVVAGVGFPRLDVEIALDVVDCGVEERSNSPPGEGTVRRIEEGNKILVVGNLVGVLDISWHSIT